MFLRSDDFGGGRGYGGRGYGGGGREEWYVGIFEVMLSLCNVTGRTEGVASVLVMIHEVVVIIEMVAHLGGAQGKTGKLLVLLGVEIERTRPDLVSPFVCRYGGGGYGQHRGYGDRRFDDRGSRGFDDRGGRGFDDRGSRGFDDRGGRGFDDRGSRGFDDRGSRGFDDRGSRGFDDRGGRGFDDRGSRGFDDRGGRGFNDRGSRGFDDRGSRGFDDNRRFEGRGGRRLQDDRSSPPVQAPAERPRLQLQKRSKPVGNTEENDSTGNTNSIFGGARPVDTATKELEIEERLKRQEEKEQTRKEVGVVVFEVGVVRAL